MIRLVCISLVSFRLFLHSSRIRILSKNLFCHSNDRASYSHYHILSSGNDIRLIITFMLARSFFFSSVQMSLSLYSLLFHSRSAHILLAFCIGRRTFYRLQIAIHIRYTTHTHAPKPNVNRRILLIILIFFLSFQFCKNSAEQTDYF